MHRPELPDPKPLPQRSGRQVRFDPLEDAGRRSHPDVETPIAAAIARAERPLPSEGRGRLILRSAGVKRPVRRRRSR